MKVRVWMEKQILDVQKEKQSRWKNIFHADGKQKRAGVAIFRQIFEVAISDKIDFKIILQELRKDTT